MPSTHPERLKCPEHFQERITQAGGLNRYGQPMFKLVWAQTELQRQGGEWDNEDGYFRGYRDVYLGDGHPHWMLLQWVDAGKCIELPFLPPQGDKVWYRETRCPSSGLQLLGEYPYRGHYQVAMSMVSKWFENGFLQVRAYPLSTEIVNMMVPIIKASMAVSHEAKMRFMRDEREKDDKDFATAVEDAWHSSKRKATLASASWLEDKQRSIEKHYNAAVMAAMHRNRVFQSHHRI